MRSCKEEDDGRVPTLKLVANNSKSTTKALIIPRRGMLSGCLAVSYSDGNKGIQRRNKELSS